MECSDYQSNKDPSDSEGSGGGDASADGSTTPCCYQRAARALHEADYLLILAGAGMSADSGLGTYETMPSRYQEFCDPARLCATTNSERDEFQAFWHSFALQYASTKPHGGYAILNNWCHGQKLKRLSSSLSKCNKPTSKQQESRRSDDTADVADGRNFETANNNALIEDHKWWVYTSNVDGHFRRFPSFQCHRGIDESIDNTKYNNVCEIHGCAGEFRCSCGMGYFDREGFSRMGDFWARWNEGVEAIRPSSLCKVRTETIEELAKRHLQQSAKSSNNTINGSSSSSTAETNRNKNRLPPCNDCESLPLRPNVLLFNDTDENVLAPIQGHRNRYQEWEAKVESSVCDPNTTNDNGINFVLVELGCGTNVPAVRNESEEVLADTLDGLLYSSEPTSSSNREINSEKSKGSVTLIRINPKDAGVDDQRLLPHVVSLYETSLRALENIDKALDSIILEH
jgi:NAD-dependent SIR2 family protein deacetylase